jgi:hypothetical protein
VGRLVHAQILLGACQRRIRLEPNPLDSRTGREAPGDPSASLPRRVGHPRHSRAGRRHGSIARYAQPAAESA